MVSSALDSSNSASTSSSWSVWGLHGHRPGTNAIGAVVVEGFGTFVLVLVIISAAIAAALFTVRCRGSLWIARSSASRGVGSRQSRCKSGKNFGRSSEPGRDLGAGGPPSLQMGLCALVPRRAARWSDGRCGCRMESLRWESTDDGSPRSDVPVDRHWPWSGLSCRDSGDIHPRLGSRVGWIKSQGLARHFSGGYRLCTGGRDLHRWAGQRWGCEPRPSPRSDVGLGEIY